MWRKSLCTTFTFGVQLFCELLGTRERAKQIPASPLPGVQPVDEAAAIEFRERARLDELGGLTLRKARVSFRKVIQGCLDRAFRGVGFRRKFSVSIALLQRLGIIGSQELFKYAQAFLFTAIEEMNAAHDRAKHSAGKVGVVSDKQPAAGQGGPLVFDFQIGEIDEKVHSRLARKKRPRRFLHKRSLHSQKSTDVGPEKITWLLPEAFSVGVDENLVFFFLQKFQQSSVELLGPLELRPVPRFVHENES
jgi:hypothetical protein